MKLLSISVRYIVLALITATLASCFFMSTEAPKPPKPREEVSPEVPMSEEYIRSRQGDLLVFYPQKWFLINVEHKVSADVVAVAVNPEYTLSLVIQSLRSSDVVKQKFQTEGLLGLARFAWDKRSSKALSTLKLEGSFSKIEVAAKPYGTYEFTQAGAGTTSVIKIRSAVLVSALGNFYEVSLVPTPITTAQIPEEGELQKIFRSVLIALQY